MDSFEAHNIVFLNLEDVDDKERQELLNSLHSENSNVELPWKVSSTKAIEKTDTNFQYPSVNTHGDNKEKTVPPQQHYPVYVSSQVEYAPYLTPPNHFNSPGLYPSAISYPITQPQYIVYSPLPSTYPTYPIAAPIVASNIPDNVNYPSNIHNSNMHSPCVNDDYVTQATEIQYLNQESYQEERHTSPPDSEILPCEDEPSAQKDDYILPEKNDNGTSLNIENTSEIKHNGIQPGEMRQQATNKSWASLFSSANKPKELVSNGINNSELKKTALSEAVNKPNVNNNNNNNNENDKVCPIRHPKKAQFANPNYYRIGEFLLKHNLDGRTISLQPRGLINRSNYCYINSILQALLACPPVYNLMTGILAQNALNEKEKTTPIIDGMCRFVKEFEHLPAGLRVNRRNEKNLKKDQGLIIDYSTPFEPSWIYKMLNGVRSDSFLIEGRQEDAEEFLLCLLNGLNDEMIELMKLVKSDFSSNDVTHKSSEQEIDKEWQVMGPKNKGSVTRKTNFIKTPISDIFGGSLKSRIHRAGDQSTYNIQPFFTLQLNIEKVQTVREALEALASKNQLEGLTSEKTKEEVEAWQQVTLEELPIILILHLKCFDFKLDGCTKIVKALDFPIDLKIDSKLLSSKPTTPKEKQYKLLAVVYHDGKEATKGHYITDAFHVGYSSWIRYDDCSVKAVQEEHVLKPQGTRVPYLLFYRRSDTIRSK